MSDVIELMRHHIAANRDLATADAALADLVHERADKHDTDFETAWKDVYERARLRTEWERWTNGDGDCCDAVRGKNDYCVRIAGHTGQHADLKFMGNLVKWDA